MLDNEGVKEATEKNGAEHNGQGDLFVEPSAARPHRRRGLLRRLGSTMAAIARDAGSVIDDEVHLDAARLIAAAFRDGDASSGLTRTQIFERIGWTDIDQAILDNRFEVLLKLEMLQPVLDKRHQERYVLNPAGLAGLLMFERAASRGGIDEVLMLLSRTRDEIDRNLLTPEEVGRRLEDLRGILTVLAADAERLTQTAPLHELIDQRSQHDERVLREVQTLNSLVTGRFRSLDPAATRLLAAALHYFNALQGLVSRILDEGSRSQDFSLLKPEEYLTAALEADVSVLAQVVSEVVFDPPMPWVDATAIVDALEHYSPQAHIRIPPPELDNVDRADPLERINRLAAEQAESLSRDAEIVLAGQDRANVTPPQNGVAWQRAALELGRMIRIDIERQLGYRLVFGDAMRIVPDGEVTYSSPVELIRTATESRLELHVLEGGVESA